VDTDCPSFDDGLAVDDLTVSFISIAPAPPSITAQPQNQTVTAGNDVTFVVIANGTPPFSFQWKSNNVSVIGATNDTFTLFSVTTNLSSSSYFVTITNMAGATNSQIATLTVGPAPTLQSNSFTIVQYNVMGNFASDWSTNAPQVQAIGRELTYLNPDIITFNEIPNTMRGEMTNWGKAFLSGYNIYVSTGTDGAIRNAIASRFPIVRTNSWLDGVTLTNFNPAVTNGFTRDLFEAEIAMPGFAQNLHVFSVHLKSGTSDSYDAARRAAEASAVSNFFATSFLTTNYLHPYILTGDMNEDIDHPATGSQQPIQRLISSPTRLLLTTPLNPITHSNVTHSIQGTLDRRYDYIMPCPLLFSNMVSSQVFRTDLLTNPPSPLLTNDDVVASDHLPVLMTFNNPFYKPFNTTSFSRTGTNVSLNWQSVPGQTYRVEVSTNLTAWTALATNLMATNYSVAFTTNSTSGVNFFRVRSP
jgi:endonuclease/exonuclease/phosphatase family metal-dependent hydrolase